MRFRRLLTGVALCNAPTTVKLFVAAHAPPIRRSADGKFLVASRCPSSVHATSVPTGQCLDSRPSGRSSEACPLGRTELCRTVSGEGR